MLGDPCKGKTIFMNTLSLQYTHSPPPTTEDIRFGQVKTNNEWRYYQLHEVGGNMPAEYRITNVYPGTDAFMVVYEALDEQTVEYLADLRKEIQYFSPDVPVMAVQSLLEWAETESTEASKASLRQLGYQEVSKTLITDFDSCIGTIKSVAGMVQSD